MISAKLQDNSGLKNLVKIFSLLYLFNMKSQTQWTKIVQQNLLKLCNILLDMNKTNLAFKLLLNLGDQND